MTGVFIQKKKKINIKYALQLFYSFFIFSILAEVQNIILIISDQEISIL